MINCNCIDGDNQELLIDAIDDSIRKEKELQEAYTHLDFDNDEEKDKKKELIQHSFKRIEDLENLKKEVFKIQIC